MVDIASLIAQHQVKVTIVTTPLNASRVGATVSRASASGLPVRLLEVEFPSTEAGIPEGCENLDALPNMALMTNFMAATGMLQTPIERLLKEVTPPPSCIVSDRNLFWTGNLARDLGIPRVLFDGKSCFNNLCMYNLHLYKPHEKVADRSELFTIPGMPGNIKFTRAQLHSDFNSPSNVNMEEIRKPIREESEAAHGVIINSFEELETEYVKAYKKTNEGTRSWCIGPVSLCNKNMLDISQRGNRSSEDESRFLGWLNSHPPRSVIYACLGSLNRVKPDQMKELGRGLELSKSPFIWVIRGANQGEQLKRWLWEDGFEERVKGRGLLIRGWVPQVLLLSNPSVGGFLTHCGWNSTLEGISAGVPMVTWPLFGEQFYNEKVLVEVLQVGVSVGAKEVVHLGEEDMHGDMVKEEDVRVAVDEVMSGDDEVTKRRKRAKELAKKAREAVEEGGSSYVNIKKYIEYIGEAQS
ncbi:hypothetical protein CDL15_Pgr011918 [Punica granatum]|nr:hypothetical protein CDL15_Pgr011918 [Punica granatum]